MDFIKYRRLRGRLYQEDDTVSFINWWRLENCGHLTSSTTKLP